VLHVQTIPFLQPSTRIRTYGGKARYVPVSDSAKPILRPAGCSLDSRDPTQTLDSRAFMRRLFELALRNAGIVGASWHTVRHTAVSCRGMAGVDLAIVREFLNHTPLQPPDAEASPEAVKKGNLVQTVRTLHLMTASEVSGEQGK